MKYEIETKDGKITLDTNQVMDMLLKHLTQQAKPDCEQLTTTFVKFLQSSLALAELNASQLAHMSLMLGYYYRIFLEKNNVTTQEENESPTTQSG